MGVHGDDVGGEVQDPIQEPRAGADDPARYGVPQPLVPATAAPATSATAGSVAVVAVPPAPASSASGAGLGGLH
jgi:hypothetical protein